MRSDIETAAAAAATDILDTAAIPDIVWSLANKSLLNIDAPAGGTRFRFPQTVRTFARRHDPGHDVSSAARRLATWYLDRLGPTCALDRGWVARMDEEVDNLRGLIPLLAGDHPRSRSNSRGRSANITISSSPTATASRR